MAAGGEQSFHGSARHGSQVLHAGGRRETDEALPVAGVDSQLRADLCEQADRLTANKST